MLKNYKQNAVSENLEFGKDGVKVSTTNQDNFTVKNNAGELVPVRAAAPIGDNDVVTLKHLKMKADVRVIGSVADEASLPAHGTVLTQIYHDIAGDNIHYAAVDGWELINVDGGPDKLVLFTIASGNKLADHIYQWDGTGNVWIDLGVSPDTLVGVTKVINSVITFVNGDGGKVDDLLATVPNDVKCVSLIIKPITAVTGGNIVIEHTEASLYNVTVVGDSYAIDYEIDSGEVSSFNITSVDDTAGVIQVSLTYVV